jgi:DNA-binding NarL/FixJ family response regulator
VGAGVAFADDEGHRTKAIAAKLNLSVKTAETDRTQLM